MRWEGNLKLKLQPPIRARRAASLGESLNIPGFAAIDPLPRAAI
jgi:hypothetical protein